MNRYYNVSSLEESSEWDFTIQPEAAPDAPEHRPSASQEDSNTLRDHNLSSLLRMHVSAPGRRRLQAVATSTPIGHVVNEDQDHFMISPVQPATLSVSSIKSDLTESPPAASLDNNNTGQPPPPSPAAPLSPAAPPSPPSSPSPAAPPSPLSCCIII